MSQAEQYTSQELALESKTACLLVRAQLHDQSLRRRFDEWYGSYHLALTVLRLRAQSARRFWSRTNNDVHYALYEFESMAVLEERMNSEDLRFLTADFDAAWPAGVTRTRDLIEQVQELRQEAAGL